MGSNPISPTIVIDTSPLQALYRASVLPTLQLYFERTLVPRAVYDETQRSLLQAPAGRVPDLEDFKWIEVADVTDDELRSAGAVPAGKRRSTDVCQWLGRQVGRPVAEAIILARRIGTTCLIEDAKGVSCAGQVGVEVVNVADVLVALQRAGLIADARTCAGDILATGYYSKQLRWLSWRPSPVPQTGPAY